GGNIMTLTISLESSELAGQTGDAGSAITNKRAFKTTVLVENGGTVVVGGLIRDSKITGESRVPFLGRIPLIGEAFKSRNGKREQSNLMVFIRPKIITDSYQAQVESNAKYNVIRDAQRLQNNQKELFPLLPFDNPPVLPPATPLPAPPVTPAAPAATTKPVEPTRP
ncbi:MAG: type II secretion system protein GspD, partial [Steroidobacteraceae bacterium]